MLASDQQALGEDFWMTCYVQFVQILLQHCWSTSSFRIHHFILNLFRKKKVIINQKNYRKLKSGVWNKLIIAHLTFSSYDSVFKLQLSCWLCW